MSKIKGISRLVLPILAISWLIPGARGRGVHITSLAQMETDGNGFKLVSLRGQEGFQQWSVHLGGYIEDFQVDEENFKSLSPLQTDFRWTPRELDPAEDDKMDKLCLVTWQNLKGNYQRVDEVNSNSNWPIYHISMGTPFEVFKYLKTNSTPQDELLGDNSHETLRSERRDRKSKEKFGITPMLSEDQMQKNKRLDSPFSASWIEDTVRKAREEYWSYDLQLGYFDKIKDRDRLEEELDRIGKPWARGETERIRCSNKGWGCRDITETINQYADLLSGSIAKQLNTALLDMVERWELVFYVPISKRPISVHERNLIDSIHGNGIQQITQGVYLEESLTNLELTFDLNTLRNKLRDLEKVPYERAALKPFSSWVKWVDPIAYIIGVVGSIAACKYFKSDYLLLKIE